MADPLGKFDDLERIKTTDTDDYSALYSNVVIDTPVGPYFMKFIEIVLGPEKESISLAEMQAKFKETKTEHIRTSLKKVWLEDFYDFVVEKLNPLSVQLMGDLLCFEADFKTIQVCYNSIGSKEVNQADKRVEWRKELSPAFGLLYPDRYKDVLITATLEDLKLSLKGVGNYLDVLKDVPDPMKKEEFNVTVKTIDDSINEEEVRRYSEAFEEQS